ncbi:MerR family transcriptional regulator [Cyanobium sp. HWJ4-Hawea]|uniref:MerR family transcriptional regulator n=1 Tax=Cyanobium sp. HWJ4-Hawea TaxID=2823713 RepID=UPI0020CC4957|nr:MerR family transcriptional regulator [Cyanobium sp. HWJ4-Hawea]MCP9808536.1 MerR family transcriptional regulator [Cyanobium sp. HWJ4-Hawea]
MADAKLLKIGDVSARSGLTVKTIRFYCDEGLIHPDSRSDGGYRLFDPKVFKDLSFIRTLRDLDISLADVMKILESRRSGICTCTSLQGTIRSKAGEIEYKITALRAISIELMSLLNDWQDCGGRKT